MTKNEIRALYKSRRGRISKEQISVLSSMATEHFLLTDIYRGADTIMLYMSIGGEADMSEIMARAFADGKRVALPVTSAEGTITPVYATEDTTYTKGIFSIPEPTVKQIVPSYDIDVIIVPGIAFDKEGGRVGYGKGCYDRFLPHTNAIKIGCCFKEMVCCKIETDATDIPMDFLLTEEGISRCG